MASANPAQPKRAEEAMRIAMIGTRGVPARYGGFETAIEEVGQRLTEQGHEVRVYCRRRSLEDREMANYLGMQRIVLPALRVKVAETLSHTFLSIMHMLRWPTDVAIVFNAANSPFVPILRVRGVPTAVHVDGLEWRRGKWSKLGKLYYRICERISAATASGLIADAYAIQEYYASRYSAESTYISYGAPILKSGQPELLSSLQLAPFGYHLLVARFEPENHVLEIIRGYLESDAVKPLVVVGSAPYRGQYTNEIERLTSSSDRIIALGAVWDQQLLNSLYANCVCFMHGHSVGGTNPSLLRAMGAGAFVCAWDVNFNREVLGDTGQYFTSTQQLRRLVEKAEQNPADALEAGQSAAARAAELYRWDNVAAQYQSFCEQLQANS